MDGGEEAKASPTAEKFPPFIKVKWESGEEDIHYFLMYEDYPKDLRLLYEKELNETPEKRESGLSRLKEIIKRENLESLNDTYLLAVLRSTKFNLKKSESKLRNFIKCRRQVIKKLAKIDQSMIKTILDCTPGGLLPYRDKHGRTIFYVWPYGIHLDKFNTDDAAMVILAGVLHLLTFELTTSAGLVFLAECKTPSANIWLHVLNIIRKDMSKLLKCPLRIAKIELFDEFPLIHWVHNVCRLLMPEKVFNRISFLGSQDNLKKLYHPDILPEEFGGNLGRLSNDSFKQELSDFIADLVEEGKSLPNE